MATTLCSNQACHRLARHHVQIGLHSYDWCDRHAYILISDVSDLDNWTREGNAISGAPVYSNPDYRGYWFLDHYFNQDGTRVIRTTLRCYTGKVQSTLEVW